jgi:hypothetical protein
MKNIIVTAGLAVLGVASLQAAYAPGLTPQEKSKLWTVSAVLRGFYDDNYLTANKSAERDSFGLEISPSLGVNLSLDQTLIGFSYTYSMRYYEDRSNNTADHTHQVNFKLDHQFSERYKASLSDRFVAAQEPQVLDPDGVVTSPLRTDGNNIRNTARIGFDAEFTPLFGAGISYANSIFDYEQEGSGSRSALLDRMEHLGSLVGRWQATPSTTGRLNYDYYAVEHTSNESIDQLTAVGAPFQDPNQRDSTTHRVYVGVDQSFSSQLSASLSVGAEFTEFPDAPAGEAKDSVGPYADANVSWTYNPGSYLQLGVKHQRNQTDVGYTFSPTPTKDQESTAFWLVVNHRISPNLTGSAIGHFQHSSFEGGGVDGDTENLFMAGVNLSYQFNAFLSAETGYNYDRLDSDLDNRSFTRNRVYIGLRASY